VASRGSAPLSRRGRPHRAGERRTFCHPGEEQILAATPTGRNRAPVGSRSEPPSSPGPARVAPLRAARRAPDLGLKRAARGRVPFQRTGPSSSLRLLRASSATTALNC
jgi:hypothetical protein